MTCPILGCADPNCQRALAWQGWRVAEQARHAQALLDAVAFLDQDGG